MARCGRGLRHRCRAALLLLAVLAGGSRAATEPPEKRLRVELSSHGAPRHPEALVRVHLCAGCCDPRQGGSVLLGLRNVNGPSDFDAFGDLVYMVPNHGQRKPLNAVDLRGRIALVDRGMDVAIVDKVKRAQDAGAVGVLLVDDSQCTADLSSCGLAGGVPDGGFGRIDPRENWRDVQVPVVMVHHSQGERIKAMMDNYVLLIPKLGEQSITRV